MNDEQLKRLFLEWGIYSQYPGYSFNQFIDRELEAFRAIVWFDVSPDRAGAKKILTGLVSDFDCEEPQIYRDIAHYISSAESDEIRCYMYQLTEMLLLDQNRNLQVISLKDRITFLKYFSSIAQSLHESQAMQPAQQVLQEIFLQNRYNFSNGGVINMLPEVMILDFFRIVSELVAVNPLFITIDYSVTRLGALLMIDELNKANKSYERLQAIDRAKFNLSILSCLVKHLNSEQLQYYRTEANQEFFEYYCKQLFSLFDRLDIFFSHHVIPDVISRQLENLIAQLRQFDEMPLLQRFIIEFLFKYDDRQKFSWENLLLSEYSEISPAFWDFTQKIYRLSNQAPVLMQLTNLLDVQLAREQKPSILFAVDPACERMLRFIEVLLAKFSINLTDDLFKIIIFLVVNCADVLDAFVTNRCSAVLTQYGEKFEKTVDPLFFIVLPYLSYQLQITNEYVISNEVWLRINKLYAVACQHLEENDVFNSFYSVYKVIPYLMAGPDEAFNAFLEHLTHYGFKHSDVYIDGARNPIFMLTCEEQNTYISNLLLLFEIAENQNANRLENIDLIDLIVITIKFPKREFEQFLNIIKTYSFEQASVFAALLTLQITKFYVGASINVLVMQEFFEKCWTIVAEKIKSSKCSELFNFQWIVKNYPGIFLSNNVNELVALIKIVDSDRSFNYLSEIFRECRALQYEPWTQGVEELFKHAEILGNFGYHKIKALLLHVKAMPFLSQVENHFILDVLVEFYSQCCSKIFLEIFGLEIGVFGRLIEPLCQHHPDLFLVKNIEMLEQVLQSYLEFARVHQKYFQPLSRYYAYDKYCQSEFQNLGSKCENDFQQLVQQGFVTDTGAITDTFKRNTFIQNPKQTEQLQARFDQSLEAFATLLLEFKSQIQDMIANRNLEELKAFLSRMIRLIQIIGTSEIIKADAPFLQESDLEQLVDLDKNQRSYILPILKRFKIIDENGKIIDRDFDKIKYQLHVNQEGKFTNWISNLVKLLNEKLEDQNHLLQLFFFIPRMNTLWTDVKNYFELLIDLLPRIKTPSQLRNMYLLLQFSFDAETVKTLTFLDPNRLPIRVSELPSMMNSVDQINALKYIRVFRMRSYSRLCLDLICQQSVSDELRIEAVNALASIAVEFPVEYDTARVITVSDKLLMLFNGYSQSLDLRVATVNALSRLNLDPCNIELRDRFITTMKETVVENTASIPLLSALLNAIHHFYFEWQTDKEHLSYFASLTFNDKTLQEALAILLSDQADLDCLIKAWEILSGEHWPYATYLPQETEGFQGGFNTYCRRPIELERSKHHILWKIKGNLLRFASNASSVSIPKSNREERNPFVHYLKSIPESTRFNLVPFIYPKNCVLFRGIGTSDGEQQVFLALMDVIAQGSSGADISHASVFGQTNSKTEQIFATASLEIATSPRYFSLTNGFLLCIDPNYFNQMVMRGEYRMEREDEYNIVLYHRIPPIGILHIFVPERFKHDLELIANDGINVSDLKAQFTSAEFKGVDNEKIMDLRYYLNRKHKSLVTSNERVSMFSKLVFFKPDTNTVEAARSFVSETLEKTKRVILQDGVSYHNGGMERTMLPDERHVICITEHLINSEKIWDQYADKFPSVDVVQEITSSSDEVFYTQFTRIAAFLPYELRMLIYRQNQFTTKYNGTVMNYFFGKSYREKSLWNKLVSGFSSNNEHRVITDRFLNESLFKLETNVRKVIRCAYMIFFYLTDKYQDTYQNFDFNQVYGLLFSRQHADGVSGFTIFFHFTEHEELIVRQLTQALFLYYMMLDKSVLGYESFIQLYFSNVKYIEQLIFMLFKATCESPDLFLEHQQYLRSKKNIDSSKNLEITKLSESLSLQH